MPPSQRKRLEIKILVPSLPCAAVPWVCAARCGDLKGSHEPEAPVLLPQPLLLFRMSSEEAVFSVSESWSLLCWCLESSVVVALVAPGGQAGTVPDLWMQQLCCVLGPYSPDFYCPSLSNGFVSTSFLTCNCFFLEIPALFS